MRGRQHPYADIRGRHVRNTQIAGYPVGLHGKNNNTRHDRKTQRVVSRQHPYNDIRGRHISGPARVPGYPKKTHTTGAGMVDDVEDFFDSMWHWRRNTRDNARERARKRALERSTTGSGAAPQPPQQQQSAAGSGHGDFFQFHMAHEDVALSDVQLRQILQDPKARVVPVHEIRSKNMQNMDDLLGPAGWVVLLYEFAENSGHYLAVLRHQNYIEIWDSFGKAPEVALSTNFTYDNPDVHILQKLVEATPGLDASRTVHNTQQFQEDTENSQVCGRYATFRILHRDMEMDQFNHMMSGVQKHMKTDDFLTLITDLHIRYNS